nr:unnamed protein product [Spirometra erinaceieuropaei]
MFPRRGDAVCTSRRCELRHLAAWAERMITHRQIDVSVDRVGDRHSRLQQFSHCLVAGSRQYPRVGEVELMAFLQRLVPENFRKTTLKSLLAPELVYKVDGLAPSPFCAFEEYFGALKQIFQSESSQAAEQQRFFNRTQRDGETLLNFYIELKHLSFRAFPPHGDEELTFCRMMSGIRDRELALIFTSRPPANVKEALDLDSARRTQFPLAQEPQATRDPTTWGHPPNLPGRSTPYHTTLNRRFQPPRLPGPPNNNQCYYCDRFGTAAKKCGHNSGNQPFL